MKAQCYEGQGLKNRLKLQRTYYTIPFVKSLAPQTSENFGGFVKDFVIFITARSLQGNNRLTIASFHERTSIML